MCEDVIARYVANVNQDVSQQAQLEDALSLNFIFFPGVQCSITPTTPNSTTYKQPWPQYQGTFTSWYPRFATLGSAVALENWERVPQPSFGSPTAAVSRPTPAPPPPSTGYQSLIIPPGCTLTMRPNAQSAHYRIFSGPLVLSDLSQHIWDTSAIIPPTSNLVSEPIGYVEVHWSAPTVLRAERVESCMGRIRTWGNTTLQYLTPGQAYCDSFMKNHCAHPNYRLTSECSCFLEEADLQQQSSTKTFPVACFGQRCALERGYKTSTMRGTICNTIYCQSQLQQSEDVFVTSESRIYCGGQHFVQPDTTQTTVVVDPGVDGTTTPSTPPLTTMVQKIPLESISLTWYTMGMYIGAALLFLLLLYLMFSSTPPTPRSPVHPTDPAARTSTALVPPMVSPPLIQHVEPAPWANY